MKDLSTHQITEVSGGNPVLVVAAAVFLVGNLMDVAYNAGKAFKEGYDSNNKI